MENARKRGHARLMLRWPGRRAQLRLISCDDPGLGDLFEAYELAWEAASYWAKIDTVMASERACEYRDLAIATEEDILHRIS
jgi:hypothetical protein